MNQDDPWKAAIEWLNRTNGYLSGFHHKDQHEKEFVERLIAQEWCASMRRLFGVDVGNPVKNEDDPPDFHVDVDGERKSVEITLLVTPENLQRALKGENPYSGSLFMDTQWDEGPFKDKIASILRQKGDRYGKRGLAVDILVIMCAEPWVSPKAAAEWLSDFDPPRPDSIGAAFVLFDYQPGRDGGEWPLLHVYDKNDRGLPRQRPDTSQQR